MLPRIDADILRTDEMWEIAVRIQKEIWRIYDSFNYADFGLNSADKVRCTGIQGRAGKCLSRRANQPSSFPNGVGTPTACLDH